MLYLSPLSVGVHYSRASAIFHRPSKRERERVSGRRSRGRRADKRIDGDDVRREPTSGCSRAPRPAPQREHADPTRLSNDRRDFNADVAPVFFLRPLARLAVRRTKKQSQKEVGRR